MHILGLLLVDLVIIGITMEVLSKILRAKISATAFCAVALMSLVVTVIYDQIQYEQGAPTSLWTGVWVSAILTIAYEFLVSRKSSKMDNPDL